MSAATPLLPAFARAELAFERGEGAVLYTADGTPYLDFAGGIAVNSLGHCHPHLVEALKRQAERLWHVSNLYQIPEQEKLGRRLVEATGLDYAFFCNSGAEANEGAIKTARKYHAAKGHPERYRIVTVEGAFHGRTLATLAAGGQQKYLEGFGPKADGFDQVPFGDFAALEAAVGENTAAILVEPIQAEGGVRAFGTDFLRKIRALCDAKGILLILDEVQTGVGRTGRLFAYEWGGIRPDILSVAKGIGSGFPIGVFLCTAEAGSGMKPGTHGTTFGGNPLACAVGNAVLDVILDDPSFLERVRRVASYAQQRLGALTDRHPRVIAEVRGEGLLLGLRMHTPAAEMQGKLRQHKLLTVTAGDNVVRLLPPLIITEADVDAAAERIETACREIEASLPGEGAAA